MSDIVISIEAMPEELKDALIAAIPEVPFTPERDVLVKNKLLARVRATQGGASHRSAPTKAPGNRWDHWWIVVSCPTMA